MKSCKNCIHLEHYEADFEEFGHYGFYCNGRDYKTSDDEYRHLYLLTQDDYLARGKKCCELKDDAGI